MEILANAALLFLSGTLVHFLWWRVKVPAGQTVTLLKIYAGTFLVWLTCWSLGHQALWVHSASDLLQCSLLYVSVVLAYAVTYSAIEAESPTLTVMMIVSKGPESGTNLETVFAYMEHHPLLRERLKGLLDSGALVIENERLRLGRPPSPSLRLVMHYRRLFGHMETAG